MKLCEGCGRHVRESICPFCGAEITSPALSRARVRGSRTARILGIAAIGVACGGTTSPSDAGGGSDAGSTDATDDFAPGPMYGAVMPDAGNDASDSSSDATSPDSGGVPLYGAPPPVEGGT